MRASAEPPIEIHTGRGIAWAFTLVGAFGVVGISWAVDGAWSWLPAAFFGLGAIVGIKLLLRPQRLLQMVDQDLLLYSGALAERGHQVSISVADITDYQVHKISDGEGGSAWFLTLQLNKQLDLGEVAQRWIRHTTKHTSLIKDDPYLLHWQLTWPQGGGKRVKKTLDLYLRPKLTS